MDFLDSIRKNREMVRIIIGNAQTGSIGVKAPTKSLTLIDTSVEEIYEIIFDAIDKRRNKNEPIRRKNN